MKLLAQLLIIIYLIGHPGKGVSVSMVDMINDTRLSNGQKILSESSVLDKSASLKCTDMFEKGYWAHVAPDGTQPWFFFGQVSYKYVHAGENLARDFSGYRSAENALMASPTHRKNILDPDYEEVGIASCSGTLNGIETSIIVQHFGGK